MVTITTIQYEIDFEDTALNAAMSNGTYSSGYGASGSPGLITAGAVGFPLNNAGTNRLMRFGDSNGGGSPNIGPVPNEAAITNGNADGQRFFEGETYTITFDARAQSSPNQDIQVWFVSTGNDGVFDGINPTDGDDFVLDSIVIDVNGNGTYTGSWTPTLADLGNKSVEGYFVIGRSNSLNFQNIRLDNLSFNATICFESGTKILTERGEKSVRDLRLGDALVTLDGHSSTIRWISRFEVSTTDVENNPKLMPIRISTGALGNGLPVRDLVVSRQHRLLVSSQIAKRMTDNDQVLVPAIKLVGLPGIEVVKMTTPVTYVHFLLDNHEVVISDGAPSESLLLGVEARKVLSNSDFERIKRLFPDLVSDELQSARPILDGKKARNLIARHKKNNQPLLQTLDFSVANMQTSQRPSLFQDTVNLNNLTQAA